MKWKIIKLHCDYIFKMFYILVWDIHQSCKTNKNMYKVEFIEESQFFFLNKHLSASHPNVDNEKEFSRPNVSIIH